MQTKKRILNHLALLYGEDDAQQIWQQLQPQLEQFRQTHPHQESPPEDILTQKDVILITYGDQIRSEGEEPLQTLADFVETYLQDFISTIHLLPFFPYSSDDGFSVIDYRQVDPDLGAWGHIEKIGQCCDLMFDAVINHISRESAWFQRFRKGEEPYDEYFITVGPDVDLSQVVRPRALPLLTPVETKQGLRHVWTTFSNDQIDLNFANPDVMLEIIDLLLFYIDHGAQIIRLDAIAYLWKEIGTSCIHLPQTHHVVKLFRAILDFAAPDVILITETNVPHEENISYFGDALDSGTGGEAAPRGDEAQMVYQFPLAPLVLHTFHGGDARKLTEWASSLEAPFGNTTFFNFIASHDGIGVRPAEGILTDEEVQALVDRTMAHGGHVSYKTNQDGSKSVYELNITFFDALNDPAKPDHQLDLKRFLASQAIMLTLAGVPGIYVHSLFGSRNCHTCVEETGRARSINREKFQREALEASLANPESLSARVYNGYAQLLAARRQHLAFHPQGEQQILSLGEQIFAALRTAPDRSEQILALTNVIDQPVTLRVTASDALPSASRWHDLFTDVNVEIPADIELPPYQVFWLQRK